MGVLSNPKTVPIIVIEFIVKMYRSAKQSSVLVQILPTSCRYGVLGVIDKPNSISGFL